MRGSQRRKLYRWLAAGQVVACALVAALLLLTRLRALPTIAAAIELGEDFGALGAQTASLVLYMSALFSLAMLAGGRAARYWWLRRFPRPVR